jgi:CRP-like cAMP-binding protein
MSHTTGAEDVERVVAFLEQADVGDAETSPLARYERHRDLTTSAPRTEAARFTLLDELSRDDARHVRQAGTPREAAADETIVEQWAATKDFFVIVEGTVDVRVDGQSVAELGPGEFFGEIAALDWGAGFGYPRIAQVVAATPLSLLVFPDGGLQRLVRELPSVERVIKAAVQYRLSVR